MEKTKEPFLAVALPLLAGLLSCGGPASGAGGEADSAAVNAPAMPDTVTILGDYVQPNPVDTSSLQGFRIQSGGKAEGIGLSNWEFRSWRLSGDTIFLDNISYTGGTPFECVDTGIVGTEGGSITLLGETYTKR